MSRANVLYDFAADDKDPTQMGLSTGEELTSVREVGNGWSEGTKPSGDRGVFPSSYIKIVPAAAAAATVPSPPPPPPTPAAAAAKPSPPPMRQSSIPSPPAEEKVAELDASESPDKLITEIEQNVRDWRRKLMTALIEQRFDEYYKIKNQIATLLEWRGQLTDPRAQHEWVRQQVVKLIESRRQMDEAFTVPRAVDNSIATTANSTVAELHDKHKVMEQRMLDGSNLPTCAAEQYALEESRGVRQRRANDSAAGDATDSAPSIPSYIFLKVNTFVFATPDPVQLVFSVWSRVTPERRNSLAAVQITSNPTLTSPALGGDEFIAMSEEFSVAMTNKGFPEDPEMLEKLYTFFADIPRATIRDHLFLVCRVYRLGSLNPVDITKSSKSTCAATYSTKKPVQDSDIIFRRPFGVGVLDLASLELHQLESCRTVEHTMPLYRPTGSEPYTFPALHTALMKNNGVEEGVSESIPNCTGIVLTLSVVDGTMEDLRVSRPSLRTPTEEILPFEDNKLVLTRKFLAKKVSNAAEERNDLYITLCSGKFSQGKKKSPKNIEVKMVCLLDSGQELNCLSRGVGPQMVLESSYRTAVYYHSNSPNFGETVRLAIPDGSAFDRAHLFFMVYHCKDDKRSTRGPGSFAFLPLTSEDSGVAVADGEHKLTCYSLLSGMEKGQIQPTYLKSAALTQNKTSGMFQRGSVNEELIVSVKLFSTKKTQIKELHDLINWRQRDPKQLELTLSALVRANWMDVLKMLGEVLDALVTLLNSKYRGGRHLNLQEALPVFFFFTHILEQFTREQFRSTRPVLEAYVQRASESFGKLHFVLIACIRHYLAWASKETNGENTFIMRRGLTNSLASLHLHMRFVKASFLRQRASPEEEKELHDALTSLMSQVVELMDRQEPKWIRQAQHKVLRQLWPVFQNLRDLMDADKLTSKINETLDRMQTSYSTTELQYNLDKLLLVRSFVKGFPFEDAAARMDLLQPLVDVLSGHIASPGDQRRLAMVILNDALGVVQARSSGIQLGAAVRTLAPLLPKVLKTTEEALGDAEDEGGVAAMSTAALQECNIKPVSDASTALLYLLYLQSLTGDTAVMEANMAHLEHLLATLGSMLAGHVYKEDWLVMNMLQYEVTVRILDSAASHLNRRTQAGDLHTEQLDDKFFDVGLTLLQEESLDLASASMSQARKDFIQNVGKYGDLRLMVVPILEGRWENLDQARRSATSTIDLMVKPLLKLVTSSSPVVAAMSKNMFFQLLRAEFESTRDFKHVGRHAVDAIDDIINTETAAKHDGKVVESQLLVLFRDDLAERFGADDLLNCPEAKRFLKETTELFGLLRALAIHPKNAEYEDERVYAYMKLMEFFDHLQRHDSYIKYAHMMSKELSALGLHTEAASAVLLHARLLGCDTPRGTQTVGTQGAEVVTVEGLVEESIGVAPGAHGDCKGPRANQVLEALDLGVTLLPEQTSLSRREKLYMQAMELLETGQQWEMALQLADALRRQFSAVTFEYDKLSNLLKRCASWYDQIMNVERFYPSVFRVGYYGRNYPPEIRNKEFVYRGAALEQIIDFTARIKMKFPKHEMLPPKVTPGDEHRESDTFFLQISKLTPATRPEMTDQPPAQFVTDPRLPGNLRLWRTNNCVDTFFYTRPFNKRKQMGLPKSSNEFLDLWVEKKFVRTARVYPGTQRRLEIVEQDTVFRNPIEMALESMVDKNAELEAKIKTMETLEDGGADQSYTMALNGVVDAAVNGGVENYRSMIDGAFREQNPEIAEAIDSSAERAHLPFDLSQSLRRQIELLDWGVRVHSTKVCEAMKPLSAHMETNYAKLKQALLELLKQAPTSPPGGA